jgi:hypothetical protein
MKEHHLGGLLSFGHQPLSNGYPANDPAELRRRRDATKNVCERRRLTAEADRLAKKLADLEG